MADDESDSDLDVVGEDEEVSHVVKPIPQRVRSSDAWAEISYRQLQLMARKHGFPSNLKKETLRTLLQATLEGQHEDVNFLLNEVKNTRIKSKRVRDEQAKKLSRSFKATIPHSLSCPSVKKDKTHQIVEDIVRRMMRETTARNVTICQTQTRARYGTFREPRRPVSYPPLSSSGTFVPLCHTHPGPFNHSGYQTDPNNTFWRQPSDERSFVPYNDGAIMPNYNSLPTPALVAAPSNRNLLSYTPVTAPVPRVNQPQECVPSFSNIRRNVAASSNTSTHLDELLNIKPVWSYSRPAQLDSTSVDEMSFVPYNDGAIMPNYNSLPTPALVAAPSNSNLLSYTPVPHVNQPQECVPSFSNIRRYVAASSNSSNHLDEFLNIKPVWSYSRPAQFDSTSVDERSFVPHNDGAIMPNYNSMPTPALVAAPSNSNLLSYTPVPHVNQPQECLPSFSNIRRNVAASSNTSTHLDELLNIKPVWSYSRPAQLDSTSVNGDQNQAVPMPTLMEPENKLDYSLRDSTALECLDNTAMTMSEQDLQNHQRNSSCNRPFSELESQSNYCNQKSEITMGDSGSITKPTQDNSTLNNFIKQMIYRSGSNNKSRVSCKYGCHMAFANRSYQQEHETHCMMQPFECPLPDCAWFNQLQSLGTHIYFAHNEVVQSSEATFVVNFGSQLYNSSYNPGPSNTGPKRLCFLQLVKDRLFVISVLGNFQSMQVYIYIQYLNDNHTWFSTAALEVSHIDGMLHQWKGRVQPLSFSPTKIISRQMCLIFNITIDQLAAGPFALHTKIRTHVLE